MIIRNVLLGGIILSGLAACKPQDELGHDALVSNAALSASYMNLKNFNSFEAAATTFRNSAKFMYQQFSWSYSSGPTYNSDSLDNANIEYARAVGLTGAGETIAIIDNGFRTTHEALSDKSMTVLGGTGTSSHGTAVAAIAASSQASGNMVGVAPDASLLLGNFNTTTAMTQATNQAASAGAIVQNNSWGIEVNATQSQFDANWGYSAGQAYIDALKNYARNGVIVFAASNDETRTTSDLMASLPEFVPGLEKSFIAVVNGVPTHNGSGDIVSTQLVSSRCLEAAKWCIVADGNIRSATSSSDTSYSIWTGTSFAAPQVSGAVALLAQAFPTLSAQELRARLLASADNSFYNHTGYVNFSKKVKHGYNDSYGHGFLDVAAALLPIGGSYMAASGGKAKLRVDKPVVLASGMSGNVIATRLAKHDLVFEDGMGAGFNAPANMLAAEAVGGKNPQAVLNDLLGTRLDSNMVDPFNTQSVFSSYIGGQELNVDLDTASLTFLLPDETSPQDSFGLAVSRSLQLEGADLNLGFATMKEADGFVGMKSLLDHDGVSALHAAATLDLNMPLQPNRMLQVSGLVGVAVPTNSISSVSMSPARYNALKLTYAANDLWENGDRFSLSVGLPHAVSAGSAQFDLPVTRTRSGKTVFQKVAIPLVPEGRQVDLTVGYGLPLSSSTELLMSATHALNAGNVEGATASGAAIGWKVRF